ncbi:hypothetical protein ACWDKQ_13010 [Saccharopolyspora sp. NPDC000995]
MAGEVQPAATTPGAGASTVRDTREIQVGQWTQEELNHAIDQAKKLDFSSGEKDAAGQIVQHTHDVRGLARADAVVPLEDVVALVAAKRRNLGDDEVVAFSRALADRLGTRRSEPIIQAGAGPSPLSGVEPVPVPFGELKPLVDGGSEPHGSEAEYARDEDVVNDRSVVLSEEDLAGVSEAGRAALEAFEEATDVAARPRLVGVDGHAEVDGHHVVAFLRMLDWWGVVDHAVVVKKRKTTWKTLQGNSRELVEEGTDVWYVMGQYAPGEPDSATRPEDLLDPLTQRPLGMSLVPAHLDPGGELPGIWMENIGESAEFFVHVVDPAGVRVDYGPADQRLWRRGREAEWEGLFAVLQGKGPAELMSMVNPGVRRDQYLAQALGVDETTAQVWRMWSHLPEEWHAEALRRAITGSVVSTYGGRAEVKTLVETLVPAGARYQERLRALGELMMPQTDRRPQLEEWVEERDAPSAAEYRDELQRKVDELGGLDQVVESGPDLQVEVRDLGGPAAQRAGMRGRRPSPRDLKVLHELAHALDGREFDYLTRFFGPDYAVSWAAGVSPGDVEEWRLSRGSGRAVVRGIVLDAIVAAFGGPEGAVAVANRLRALGTEMGLQMAKRGELDPREGVQVASGRRPEGPSTAAREVFGLPTTQEWWGWTLGDVVDYVAGDAVPAEVPDGELVRHLGTARAAGVTRVDEWLARAWLGGSLQPYPHQLRLMREAARLSGSELVRYLGPGRALEVTETDWFPRTESEVWKWLAGVTGLPVGEESGKLRLAVLRAIRDGLLPPAPFRLVWSENGIREAERRLAWADAAKGDEFPSGARSQWGTVNAQGLSLRPEYQEVIDGLGKSLRASVNYIVVQVLLGNEDAKAMVEGSGIVIPDPGPGAVRGLLEQIADGLRAAKGLLHAGVLRRVVGGAASERFQAATGGVVPQLRLTGGPDAVREFMQRTAAGDVHFLVLRVPPAASQGAPRAVYVNGNDVSAFLASGGFFEDGSAHYFLDAVQGDDRRVDPESALSSKVLAGAGDDVAWWAQHGELGGPEQVAWLDGRLPRVAELLDLPEAERRGRLGNLAGIAEVAELAGRMQRHLEAMPPGFDPDGKRQRNVEAAKRMVRQGAWTAEDLQWVEDRLPGMRKVEKAWRGLASRTGRTNND